MKYKGFYVKITPDTDLHREDKDGNGVRCNGFTIEVFVDESERVQIDVFSAAVDFELLKTVLKRWSSLLWIILTAKRKSIRGLLMRDRS